jgi:hypothetical protein
MLGAGQKKNPAGGEAGFSKSMVGEGTISYEMVGGTISLAHTVPREPQKRCDLHHVLGDSGRS